MPVTADAQGLPGGMRRGAAGDDCVGGPIGGNVGGAVGIVNGALGIDPSRRGYRSGMSSQHNRHYLHRHHRRHR